MKKTLILVAALAATIGSAAAQSTQTAGGNVGGNTRGDKGNNDASSGNSANTSSSAPNSNPVTSAPNYKPGGGTKGSNKPVPNQITRSGGQGHNSGPAPKGKVVVAPTAPTSNKKSTGSSNTKTGSSGY